MYIDRAGGEKAEPLRLLPLPSPSAAAAAPEPPPQGARGGGDDDDALLASQNARGFVWKYFVCKCMESDQRS